MNKSLLKYLYELLSFGLSNSLFGRFKIFNKFDWISSPKSVLRDSTSSRDCGIGSDDTASFQLAAFHNYCSKSNVNIIIDNSRSNIATLFNIDSIPNINRKRKGLFRTPNDTFQNSIISDFTIFTHSHWVVITHCYTPKTKI